MTVLIVIGLIVAAYLIGRAVQFTRDASSVLGSDRNRRNRR
jgi:hypothetical protein